MVLAAHAYLEGGGTPQREAIQEALAGHVCRCTGYVKIIDAVAGAAGGEIEAQERWLPQPGEEAPVGSRGPRHEGRRRTTPALRRRRPRHRPHRLRRRRPPGTLWTKALRSPGPRLHHRRLDVSKAESMPGVHAVITWKDVPLLEYGHLSALGIPADEPLLAKDVVRYKGQPIVVVAAEDEETAQAAVEAIDLDLTEQPALFDVRKAFDADAQGAPLGQLVSALRGRDGPAPDPQGLDRGGVRAADVIVHVYRLAAIEHVPIETQVCPRTRGERPPDDLLLHAGALLLDGRRRRAPAGAAQPAQVRRRHGRRRLRRQGRHGDGDDVRAARLEVRPAGEVALDAEEEFLCSSTRAPWHMEIADAVTKDGWILGRKMLTLHDSGACPLLALRAHEAQPTTPAPTRSPTSSSTATSSSRTRPDHRDAGLRRHVGLLRGRDAHEPHRARARSRPVRDQAEEREPQGGHVAERDRVHRSVDDPHDPGRGGRARPRAVGRLPNRDERARSDVWLPEHLVGQLGNPEEH